jgi:hypothetical protein
VRPTVRGDHVLLAPPFIVDAPDIDTIVERLGEAIDATTRGCVEVQRALRGAAVIRSPELCEFKRVKEWGPESFH